MEWRGLRSEQGLVSDNAVAAFLLERNKLLTNVMEQQLQLEAQTSAINRLAEMASYIVRQCALYKLYRRMAASPLPTLATPVPIGTSTPISQMRGQDRHQVTKNEEETYEQCVYMLQFISQ